MSQAPGSRTLELVLALDWLGEAALSPLLSQVPWKRPEKGPVLAFIEFLFIAACH